MKEETFNRIAKAIHSDTSPVGIDAKKTHVLILAKLEELDLKLNELNSKIEDLKTNIN